MEEEKCIEIYIAPKITALANTLRTDNCKQSASAEYCKQIVEITRSGFEGASRKYEDRLGVLRCVLRAVCLTSGELQHTDSQRQMLNDLFTMCVKVVLNFQWQTIAGDNEKKLGLQRAVKAMSLCFPDFTRFSEVNALMETAWNDPIMMRIMTEGDDLDEEEETETREYIIRQDAAMLKIRIEVMLEENCEDFAVNLCSWCVLHPDLVTDIYVVTTLLTLLHKLHPHTVQFKCQQISSEFAIRILKELEKIPTNRALCVHLSQLFLIQDWIQFSDHLHTPELLNLWVRHQYASDSSDTQFTQSVWSIAKLCHHNTSLLGMLIDCLKKERWLDSSLQLLTDISIYALNLDYTIVAGEDNESMISGAEKGLIGTCDRIVGLFEGVNQGIQQAAALTAFSIEPTSSNLKALEETYQTKNDRLCENLSEQVAKPGCICHLRNRSVMSFVCKCLHFTNIGKNDSTDDMKTNPLVFHDSKTLLSKQQGVFVDPGRLYELDRLMRLLRPWYMDTALSWEDLNPVCAEYCDGKTISSERETSIRDQFDEFRMSQQDQVKIDDDTAVSRDLFLAKMLPLQNLVYGRKKRKRGRPPKHKVSPDGASDEPSWITNCVEDVIKKVSATKVSDEGLDYHDNEDTDDYDDYDDKKGDESDDSSSSSSTSSSGESATADAPPDKDPVQVSRNVTDAKPVVLADNSLLSEFSPPKLYRTKMKCIACNRVFDDFKKLSQHKKVHLLNDQSPAPTCMFYECTFCQSNHYSMDAFKQHIVQCKVKKSVEHEKHSCKCGRNFDSLAWLKRHLEVCEACAVPSVKSNTTNVAANSKTIDDRTLAAQALFSMANRSKSPRVLLGPGKRDDKSSSGLKIITNSTNVNLMCPICKQTVTKLALYKEHLAVCGTYTPHGSRGLSDFTCSACGCPCLTHANYLAHQKSCGQDRSRLNYRVNECAVDPAQVSVKGNTSTSSLNKTSSHAVIDAIAQKLPISVLAHTDQASSLLGLTTGHTQQPVVMRNLVGDVLGEDRVPPQVVTKDVLLSIVKAANSHGAKHSNVTLNQSARTQGYTRKHHIDNPNQSARTTAYLPKQYAHNPNQSARTDLYAGKQSQGFVYASQSSANAPNQCATSNACKQSGNIQSASTNAYVHTQNQLISNHNQSTAASSTCITKQSGTESHVVYTVSNEPTQQIQDNQYTISDLKWGCTCKLCDVSFGSKSLFIEHLAAKHLMAGRVVHMSKYKSVFQCRYCLRNFDMATQCLTHLRIHESVITSDMIKFVSSLDSSKRRKNPNVKTVTTSSIKTRAIATNAVNSTNRPASTSDKRLTSHTGTNGMTVPSCSLPRVSTLLSTSKVSSCSTTAQSGGVTNTTLGHPASEHYQSISASHPALSTVHLDASAVNKADLCDGKQSSQIDYKYPASLPPHCNIPDRNLCDFINFSKNLNLSQLGNPGPQSAACSEAESQTAYVRNSNLIWSSISTAPYSATTSVLISNLPQPKTADVPLSAITKPTISNAPRLVNANPLSRSAFSAQQYTNVVIQSTKSHPKATDLPHSTLAETAFIPLAHTNEISRTNSSIVVPYSGIPLTSYTNSTSSAPRTTSAPGTSSTCRLIPPLINNTTKASNSAPKVVTHSFIVSNPNAVANQYGTMLTKTASNPRKRKPKCKLPTTQAGSCNSGQTVVPMTISRPTVPNSDAFTGYLKAFSQFVNQTTICSHPENIVSHDKASLNDHRNVISQKASAQSQGGNREQKMLTEKIGVAETLASSGAKSTVSKQVEPVFKRNKASENQGQTNSGVAGNFKISSINSEAKRSDRNDAIIRCTNKYVRDYSSDLNTNNIAHNTDKRVVRDSLIMTENEYLRESVPMGESVLVEKRVDDINAHVSGIRDDFGVIVISESDKALNISEPCTIDDCKLKVMKPFVRLFDCCKCAQLNERLSVGVNPVVMLSKHNKNTADLNRDLKHVSKHGIKKELRIRLIDFLGNVASNMSRRVTAYDHVTKKMIHFQLPLQNQEPALDICFSCGKDGGFVESQIQGSVMYENVEGKQSNPPEIVASERFIYKSSQSFNSTSENTEFSRESSQENVDITAINDHPKHDEINITKNEISLENEEAAKLKKSDNGNNLSKNNDGIEFKTHEFTCSMKTMGNVKGLNEKSIAPTYKVRCEGRHRLILDTNDDVITDELREIICDIVDEICRILAENGSRVADMEVGLDEYIPERDEKSESAGETVEFSESNRGENKLSPGESHVEEFCGDGVDPAQIVMRSRTQMSGYCYVTKESETEKQKLAADMKELVDVASVDRELTKSGLHTEEKEQEMNEISAHDPMRIDEALMKVLSSGGPEIIQVSNSESTSRNFTEIVKWQPSEIKPETIEFNQIYPEKERIETEPGKCSFMEAKPQYTEFYEIAANNGKTSLVDHETIIISKSESEIRDLSKTEQIKTHIDESKPELIKLSLTVSETREFGKSETEIGKVTEDEPRSGKICGTVSETRDFNEIRTETGKLFDIVPERELSVGTPRQHEFNVPELAKCHYTERDLKMYNLERVDQEEQDEKEGISSEYKSDVVANENVISEESNSSRLQHSNILDKNVHEQSCLNNCNLIEKKKEVVKFTTADPVEEKFHEIKRYSLIFDKGNQSNFIVDYLQTENNQSQTMVDHRAVKHDRSVSRYGKSDSEFVKEHSPIGENCTILNSNEKQVHVVFDHTESSPISDSVHGLIDTYCSSGNGKSSSPVAVVTDQLLEIESTKNGNSPGSLLDESTLNVKHIHYVTLSSSYVSSSKGYFQTAMPVNQANAPETVNCCSLIDLCNRVLINTHDKSECSSAPGQNLKRTVTDDEDKIHCSEHTDESNEYSMIHEREVSVDVNNIEEDVEGQKKSKFDEKLTKSQTLERYKGSDITENVAAVYDMVSCEPRGTIQVHSTVQPGLQKTAEVVRLNIPDTLTLVSESLPRQPVASDTLILPEIDEKFRKDNNVKFQQSVSSDIPPLPKTDDLTCPGTDVKGDERDAHERCIFSDDSIFSESQENSVNLTYDDNLTVSDPSISRTDENERSIVSVAETVHKNNQQPLDLPDNTPRAQLNASKPDKKMLGFSLSKNSRRNKIPERLIERKSDDLSQRSLPLRRRSRVTCIDEKHPQTLPLGKRKSSRPSKYVECVWEVNIPKKYPQMSSPQITKIGNRLLRSDDIVVTHDTRRQQTLRKKITEGSSKYPKKREVCSKIVTSDKIHMDMADKHTEKRRIAKRNKLETDQLPLVMKSEPVMSRTVDGDSSDIVDCDSASHRVTSINMENKMNAVVAKIDESESESEDNETGSNAKTAIKESGECVRGGSALRTYNIEALSSIGSAETSGNDTESCVSASRSIECKDAQCECDKVGTDMGDDESVVDANKNGLKCVTKNEASIDEDGIRYETEISSVINGDFKSEKTRHDDEIAAKEIQVHKIDVMESTKMAENDIDATDVNLGDRETDSIPTGSSENVDDGAKSTEKLVGNINDGAETTQKLVGNMSDGAETTQKLVGNMNDGAETTQKQVGNMNDGAETTQKLVGNMNDGAETTQKLVGNMNDGAETTQKQVGNMNDGAETTQKLVGNMNDGAETTQKQVGNMNDGAETTQKLVGNMNDGAETTQKQVGNMNDGAETTQKLVGNMNDQKIDDGKVNLRRRKNEYIENADIVVEVNTMSSNKLKRRKNVNSEEHMQDIATKCDAGMGSMDVCATYPENNAYIIAKDYQKVKIVEQECGESELIYPENTESINSPVETSEEDDLDPVSVAQKQTEHMPRSESSIGSEPVKNIEGENIYKIIPPAITEQKRESSSETEDSGKYLPVTEVHHRNFLQDQRSRKTLQEALKHMKTSKPFIWDEIEADEALMNDQGPAFIKFAKRSGPKIMYSEINLIKTNQNEPSLNQKDKAQKPKRNKKKQEATPTKKHRTKAPTHNQRGQDTAPKYSSNDQTKVATDNPNFNAVAPNLNQIGLSQAPKRCVVRQIKGDEDKNIRVISGFSDSALPQSGDSTKFQISRSRSMVVSSSVFESIKYASKEGQRIVVVTKDSRELLKPPILKTVPRIKTLPHSEPLQAETKSDSASKHFLVPNTHQISNDIASGEGAKESVTKTEASSVSRRSPDLYAKQAVQKQFSPRKIRNANFTQRSVQNSFSQIAVNETNKSASMQQPYDVSSWLTKNRGMNSDKYDEHTDASTDTVHVKSYTSPLDSECIPDMKTTIDNNNVVDETAVGKNTYDANDTNNVSVTKRHSGNSVGSKDTKIECKNCAVDDIGLARKTSADRYISIKRKCKVNTQENTDICRVKSSVMDNTDHQESDCCADKNDCIKRKCKENAHDRTDKILVGESRESLETSRRAEKNVSTRMCKKNTQENVLNNKTCLVENFIRKHENEDKSIGHASKFIEPDSKNNDIGSCRKRMLRNTTKNSTQASNSVMHQRNKRMPEITPHNSPTVSSDPPLTRSPRSLPFSRDLRSSSAMMPTLSPQPNKQPRRCSTATKSSMSLSSICPKRPKRTMTQTNSPPHSPDKHIILVRPTRIVLDQFQNIQKTLTQKVQCVYKHKGVTQESLRFQKKR